MRISGFLNIDKPAGLTSHDVVARVRRLVGRQVKVGHAGTLDPAATGVLPVALGPSTRLISYLTDARKGYRAVVQFGITTTTDDAEGAVVTTQPVPSLTSTDLQSLLAPFRGTLLQIPPMYSALRRQGQRLYDLARAGQTVERTPRPVTIDHLEYLHYDAGAARLTLDVVCSKGTYIRALARDMGDALGCGAHLVGLQRTFVGPFLVAQAVALSALQEDPTLVAQVLLPPESVLTDWPAVALDEQQVRLVLNGSRLTLPDIGSDHARAHCPDGRLVALLQRQGTAWHPEKVFQE